MLPKKLKIEIERFQEGITARVSDIDGSNEVKKLAAIGNERICVGSVLWPDVQDALDQTDTDKVVINLEISESK